MVVVEERGNPAGLRQAPRERRRKRGRAAPTREELHVLGCPFASTIYRGRGRAVPSPRVPSLGVAAAPIPIWGGGQVGGRGRRTRHGPLGPICPRVCPLFSLGAWALVGRRPSPPRGWSLLTLGPCMPPGPVAPLGGPPDPSGGPGTLPVMPRTLPVAKTILPIYQSLPPDHYGTPRDVRDLIRDSEQHLVTTYKLPL